MNKFPPVSAVVLTLNEAANLDRCLASLDWCHEVVVLDSGSADETREIALQNGARFLEHIQKPPFRIDKQRNWALEHGQIKTDWVLFLDADETVPEPLRERILESINESDNGFNAFELTPRYLFWGKWLKRTQGYPNWHPRLLKREEVRFTGGVWEHFEESARVGRIDAPYDHYANSKGLSDWLRRHDRYSSWDAEKVFGFLNRGDPSSLGTARKLRLRIWAAKFWPLRPFARFMQMYFFRLGFLEGVPALAFCLLYAFYEFMTVVKIVELRRQKRGLPI